MRPHSLIRAAIVDRNTFLVAAARGKSVLHLGCADAPYFHRRGGDGTLLHSQLVAVAREIVGVDVNQEGVRFLTDDLGFKDVIRGDVESLAELKFNRTFELIVAGELLEHLPNPGLCLTGVKGLLAKDGALLVTVPNAFSLKGFLRVARGVEFVHPEHVAYFSSVTMRRLLELCGYSLVSHAYYVSKSASRLKRAVDILMFSLVRCFSPYLSDGLVVEAKVAR